MNSEVATIEDVDFSKFSNLLNPQTANQLAVVDTMAGELAELKKLKLATIEALAVAKFKDRVFEVLGQNVDLVMGLQNSPMGFKTDKKDGYDADTVKKCAVVALSYGCHLSGNQFNIIAGNAYITKEGYFYKLSELVKQGALEYRIVHGIAEPTDKFELLWKIQSEVFWKTGRGKEKSQKLDFIIKGAGLKKDWKTKQIVTDANGKPTSLTTQDQIRGKADRKCMHWLWCTFTSSHISDIPEDLEDGDIIEGKAEKVNMFDQLEKDESKADEETVKAEIVHEEKPVENKETKQEEKAQESATVKDIGELNFSEVDKSQVVSTDDHVQWMIKRCAFMEVDNMDFKNALLSQKLIPEGKVMNTLPVETLIKVCEATDAIITELKSSAK